MRAIACMASLISFLWSGCIYTEPTNSLLNCFDLENSVPRTYNLPKSLNEISGLAMTPNNTLMAHNDEFLAVYEIDQKSGSVSLYRRESGTAAMGDYEGITFAAGKIFLISSKGKFAGMPYNAKHSPVQYWNTSLGNECEIEGLTFRIDDQALVVACKKQKQKHSKLEVKLLVFYPNKEASDTEVISVDIPKENNQGIKRFRGTAVAYYAPLKHYLVLSSRKRAIAEINGEGELMGLVSLDKKIHNQPEGLEITADLELVIANEGKPGYIVVYEPRQSCRKSDISTR